LAPITKCNKNCKPLITNVCLKVHQSVCGSNFKFGTRTAIYYIYSPPISEIQSPWGHRSRCCWPHETKRITEKEFENKKKIHGQPGEFLFLLFLYWRVGVCAERNAEGNLYFSVWAHCHCLRLRPVWQPFHWLAKNWQS